MSDDSDSGPETKRKRKIPRRENSLNSETVGTTSNGRRRRPLIIDDSDSDSGSSLDIRHKRKRIPRVRSDIESDSSDSVIRRAKRTAHVISDDSGNNDSDHDSDDSSSSEWETEVSDQENTEQKNEKQDVSSDTDSSDDQLEKCPICLISLRKQEIGTPVSCEHKFCIECILEWSKNMNTCPVDRQEYKLILVRKNINSNVYKRLPIEPPNNEENIVQEIIEDLTFCEICRSSDGEETMLLCDGCDLGFHLGCLTPPLDQVPAFAWYCNDCSPIHQIELYELQVVLSDTEAGRSTTTTTRQRRNRSHRLIPRTRQTERVRRRIQNSRNTRQNSSITTEDSAFQQEQSSTSTNNDQLVSSSTSRNSRKKIKKRKKRRARYRTIYKLNEVTGETIAVKKRIRSRKKRRSPGPPKNAKARLARQLGICPLRNTAQHLPDMKVQPHSKTILHNKRQQTAIPRLHLFGQPDEIDYFSPSDNEFDASGSGSGVIARRRPNQSDVAMYRRARAKGVTIPNPVSSTSDILSDILDCQTKFHSKKTKFGIDKDGRFIMNHSDPNAVFGGNYNNSIRQRPTSNNTSNNDNVPSSSGRNEDYNADHQQYRYNSPVPSSAASTNITSNRSDGNDDEQYMPQDYTQRNLDSLEQNRNAEDCQKDKKAKNLDDGSENNTPRSNTPYSGESEVDIYSDIETVSTSKTGDADLTIPTPTPMEQTQSPNTSDDNNDSESDMIIDTEKPNPESEENTKEETAVTSTVDSNVKEPISGNTVTSVAHSTSEIQSEAVQSSSHSIYDESKKLEDQSYLDDTNDNGDDEDSEDGCPNFSIYSKESITLAKNTDISLDPGDLENPLDSQTDQVGEISSSPALVEASFEERISTPPNEVVTASSSIPAEANENTTETSPEQISNVMTKKPNVSMGLYSDSEDETIVKKNVNGTFAITDIRNMTEDISEEERSYTPCLDERGGGLEGLDTEMISDEDRNDFDESHDLKTVSDGDALEINAKESELDFSRPEDYEEGEIVDKLKSKQKTDDNKKDNNEKGDAVKTIPPILKKKEITQSKEKESNKENEGHNKEPSSFKKLSKSNKERNYRDKEKERSKSKDRNKQKSDKDDKKEKRKEKRKEIERYDVRAIIADPKRLKKDRFGRDIRRTSNSRSRSKTASPRRSASRNRSVSRNRRSLSRTRRSMSREWVRKKRGRSRTRRSISSHSRSRTPERKRSHSKNKKRKRSSTRERSKRRKSRDRSKTKKKGGHRSRSRIRSRSASPKRRKEWGRRRSRDWTPSLSMSRSPEPRHLTPSWTPPRLLENPVKPHNLTVILTNDSNKKKKDKKKRADKRSKENDKLRKRRRNDRTPPPSKEVFASGDNILVSVSFNKENETRDVSTRKKKDSLDDKKSKKEKRSKNVKKKRDLTDIKPVAIIDLERSPFKELTPSPKDVIVLSDSDNEANALPKGICDSSQQTAIPERCVNNYATGPKTPPEPQVKFTLTSKVPQLRAISNPLHEPDDVEPEADQNDLVDQTLEGLHKGPNTPPEPPNSPPSSPDAYDPFEPTKSRSPTPEPMLQATQSNSTSNIDDNRDDDDNDRSSIGEINDKSSNSINQTPEVHKSHTSPLADVQPADSQSSIQATPESNLCKSPERSGSLINQSVQTQPAFSIAAIASKPVAQTVPFSSVPTSIITSTPVNSNLTTNQSRINILNTSLITPPHVASTIPNRIVLPTTIKSSPVKISPSKPPVKSTPIKPMPSKNNITIRKTNRSQNGSGDGNDTNLNLDSPYSPGSSDYEDLFEPPAESPIKSTKTATSKPTKSPAKTQNVFDALFGSPPYNKLKNKNDKSTTNKFNKKTAPLLPAGSKGTKQIGVKIDEDNLKILDELPNSAVEMQIKDKFLKKLNRQERVVEEVKLVLKPHYNKKHINKEEYKDILRRAVPKICHNKTGEINPTKIKNLIEAYVKKVRHSKKVTSSSSVNPQKT